MSQILLVLIVLSKNAYYNSLKIPSDRSTALLTGFPQNSGVLYSYPLLPVSFCFLILGGQLGLYIAHGQLLAKAEFSHYIPEAAIKSRVWAFGFISLSI